MKAKLPALFAKVAGAVKAPDFRLLAGSFSSAEAGVRPLGYGVNVPEHVITFRLMEGGKPAGDFSLVTGTINISELGQSNHVVLLVVDVPLAENWFLGLLRHIEKRADGETIVVAAWMPDGGDGRVMVDRSNYRRWITPDGARTLGLLKMLAGVLVLSVFLAFVAPCAAFLIPIVGGYMWKRRIRKQQSQGIIATTFDLEDHLQKWALELMENGTFQSVYAEAFGIREVASARL